jgi:hypothetical protein
MAMTPMAQWVSAEDAERVEREARETAAALVRGREKNIRIFEAMWLGLGADVLRCSNQSHRSEADEALALASHRWNRLLDLEAQVAREQEILATRPKKRAAEPNDRMLAPEVVARLGSDYEQQTKSMQDELTELRKQAAAERKILEAFITTKKG